MTDTPMTEDDYKARLRRHFTAFVRASNSAAEWKAAHEALLEVRQQDIKALVTRAEKAERELAQAKLELNHSKACAIGLQNANERLRTELAQARQDGIEEGRRQMREEAKLACGVTSWWSDKDRFVASQCRDAIAAIPVKKEPIP